MGDCRESMHSGAAVCMSTPGGAVSTHPCPHVHVLPCSGVGTPGEGGVQVRSVRSGVRVLQHTVAALGAGAVFPLFLITLEQLLSPKTLFCDTIITFLHFYSTCDSKCSTHGVYSSWLCFKTQRFHVAPKATLDPSAPSQPNTA